MQRVERRSCAVWRGVACAAALAGVAAAGPQATSVELVTGTPATLSPNALVANLDAGDLVGGNTRWDHDGDGSFFVETFVGFLWSPAGGLEVFAIPEREYVKPQFQMTAEIADNRYAVGTVAYRETLLSKPFLWTPANGMRDLPIPRNTVGSAHAVSADGSVAAGEVREGLGAGAPTRAVRWTISGAQQPRARLLELASGESWSTASDVSANGDVVVGAAGPTASSAHAARWRGGVEEALAAVGGSSAAAFVSADGSVAVGTATIGAQTVLVRWLADGTAEVHAPAALDSLRELRAIAPGATAAVGQMSVAGNAAPFVWTLAEGFVVLPERGRELDYDASRATGVSDDGDTVVGSLGASVVVEGDPPQLGFVWTRAGGLATVDELLVAGGFAAIGAYEVPALSGDGLRLLATGNPPRTPFDTNSVIVTLQP
jgi:hypothetical protein